MVSAFSEGAGRLGWAGAVDGAGGSTLRGPSRSCSSSLFPCSSASLNCSCRLSRRISSVACSFAAAVDLACSAVARASASCLSLCLETCDDAQKDRMPARTAQAARKTPNKAAIVCRRDALSRERSNMDAPTVVFALAIGMILVGLAFLIGYGNYLFRQYVSRVRSQGFTKPSS